MILAFFNISGGEIFIIILVVFIIFGPDKIPEIARWMGKGLREIKKATSDIREEINRETHEVRQAADKFKNEIDHGRNSLNEIGKSIDPKNSSTINKESEKPKADAGENEQKK